MLRGVCNVPIARTEPVHQAALTTCFITDSASSQRRRHVEMQARPRYSPDATPARPACAACRRGIGGHAGALGVEEYQIISDLHRDAGICAMPRASDFALVWSSARRSMLSVHRGTPPHIPPCRIELPSRCSTAMPGRELVRAGKHRAQRCSQALGEIHHRITAVG
jgi:hypothetical protein